MTSSVSANIPWYIRLRQSRRASLLLFTIAMGALLVAVIRRAEMFAQPTEMHFAQRFGFVSFDRGGAGRAAPLPIADKRFRVDKDRHARQ